MTNEEMVQRGRRAEQLMNDTMLKEALDAIESEILEQWEACPARDVEGREELWKYHKTAKKLRLILKGTMESGKVGAFREQQTTADKLVNFVRGAR